MKLSPPVLVLTLIAMWFAAIGMLSEKKPEGNGNDACAVLKAAILYDLERLSFAIDEGKKVAFQKDPVSTKLDLASFDDPTGDKLRADLERHPLSQLYVQLYKSDSIRPIDACPQLHNLLGGHESIFLDGSEGTKRVVNPGNPDEEYKDILYSLSMPAISPDGQEALILKSTVFAPLSGGGAEVYLRKDRSGKWIVLYEAGTWIS